jgi:hypothetical protein
MTTIVNDPDILLAIYLDSLILPSNELSIVWDKRMLGHILKGYREIIYHVEKLSKQKGIKFRVIVESSENSVYFLTSLRYCDIRCLNDIQDNFQISDNRICIKPLFNPLDKEPDRILLSNSKYVINRKQSLFYILWEKAKPLSKESISQLNERTENLKKDQQNLINPYIQEIGV